MIGPVRWGRPDERTPVEVSQVTLAFDRLPGSFDGFRIALLSDLHYGHYVRAGFVRRVLKLIRRHRPDLLLLTGDMADRDGAFHTDLASMLQATCRDIPIFAALGNHDYYCGAEHFRRVMQAAGVEVLVNTHRLLRRCPGGAPPEAGDPAIALLGLDDIYGGHPDLGAAIGGIPPGTFTILTGHSPDLADLAGKDDPVDLMLCGHTHGGQVRIFGRAPVTETRNPRYVSGLTPGPGFPIYISRGLGVTRIPLRLACDPELPIITLRKKTVPPRAVAR